jgi:hypothetical protein
MVFRMKSLCRWRAGAQILQRKIPRSTNQVFVPTVVARTRMLLPLALQLRNTQGKGEYLDLSLSASDTFLYSRTTVPVLGIAALTGRIAAATIKICTFLIIPIICHHELLPLLQKLKEIPSAYGATQQSSPGLSHAGSWDCIANLRVRQSRLRRREPRVSSTGVQMIEPR